ncbi:MAG: biopolymer transporter ExbD [Ferruginibacter sp.]
MAEISTQNSQKKKAGFSRFKSHRSTRVDLTPMVDLGFLLLTFFVFTSSMTQPKIMELMEPHDGISTLVKNSYAMTIILCKDHKIYYYYGTLDPKTAHEQVRETDFSTIRYIIVNMKTKSDPHYVMYIIKADQQSTFGDNINLLDEFAICDITSGHYAEVDITREETGLIKSIK